MSRGLRPPNFALETPRGGAETWWDDWPKGELENGAAGVIPPNTELPEAPLPNEDGPCFGEEKGAIGADEKGDFDSPGTDWEENVPSPPGVADGLKAPKGDGDADAGVALKGDGKGAAVLFEVNGDEEGAEDLAKGEGLAVIVDPKAADVVAAGLGAGAVFGSPGTFDCEESDPLSPPSPANEEDAEVESKHDAGGAACI